MSFLDQQMIPFSSQMSVKQYVPNKPNPVGLKNFVLASVDGFVQTLLCTRAGVHISVQDGGDTFGIGGVAIVLLIKSLCLGTHLYCDRYFTSIPLIVLLHSCDIYITGTFIQSRLADAGTSLRNDKSLAQLGCDSVEMIALGDKKIAITK